MKEQIEIRLTQLRQELQTGQKALAEIDNRAISLKSQMLRINGAIHVLEELLTNDSEKTDSTDRPIAVGQ